MLLKKLYETILCNLIIVLAALLFCKLAFGASGYIGLSGICLDDESAAVYDTISGRYPGYNITKTSIGNKTIYSIDE